jgi:hypothetical protein
VIQIAARQTQRPFVFLQCDPGALPQVFAALAALKLEGREGYDQPADAEPSGRCVRGT